MTFFKNRFVTMIETPTFLSSDIVAEKSGYKKIIFQKLLFMTYVTIYNIYEGGG